MSDPFPAPIPIDPTRQNLRQLEYHVYRRLTDASWAVAPPLYLRYHHHYRVVFWDLNYEHDVVVGFVYHTISLWGTMVDGDGV